MRRRAGLVLFVLAFAACTSGSDRQAIERPLTSDTTTSTTLDMRQGLVPDPGAILAAQRDGSISTNEADLFMSLAMFGVVDQVPLRFMVDPVTVPPAQWDHTALSRVVDRWDELDVFVRRALSGSVVGITARLDGASVGSGCVPSTEDSVSVCEVQENNDRPAAAVVRPWVTEAVTAAWPRFEALFGSGPDEVRIHLTNLEAAGAHLSIEMGCDVYVDVADESGDPPAEEVVAAEVAHHLFHCFQHEYVDTLDLALWEGSATWAAHHVFPGSVDDRVQGWVTEPGVPFGHRRYDAAFAFIYAAERYGAGTVVDALRAGSVGALLDEEEFEVMWHELSVASWDDSLGGDDPVAGLDVSITEPETSGRLDFELDPYSRVVRIVEFGDDASVAQRSEFARLAFDLSEIPDDVAITAIPETSTGVLNPVELSLVDEWVVCRAAIGPCNDALAEEIEPYVRVTLIVTNVDNGTERFSIPWDGFNPHLDGDWVRTQGPLLTNPGTTSPYEILSTSLTFDEGAFTLSEATRDYSINGAPEGLTCTFDGSYAVEIDPVYGPPGQGDVDGEVTVTGELEGDGLVNDCELTSSSGTTSVTGLHVPIVDGPTLGFGFELRGYDTLWVYAHERIYVYQRVVE